MVSGMELSSSSSSRSSTVPGAAASIISPGHRSSKALGLLAGTPVGPHSHCCGAACWDPPQPPRERRASSRAGCSQEDSVFPQGLCQARWRGESRGRGVLPSWDLCDASQRTHAHVGVGCSAEAKRSVPNCLRSQSCPPPDLTPPGSPSLLPTELQHSASPQSVQERQR